MLNLNDTAIEKQLTELWGTAKPTTAEKRKQIEAYKHDLTEARIADADRSKGRAIFARTCMVCHRLYGEGGTIGPDLTGSGRDNIDYLLDNIVDPSGVVADQFKLSVIRLMGGRVVSGTIVSRDANTTVVQTASERLSLPTDQVEDVQTLPISLMPEGQLQTLSADEVRDLIGYLMSKSQAPLPGASR